MRARNLKPGFYKNEELAECTPWARLCFAGLWLLADREGRLEDRPKRIKGELFAFDSVEVEPLLRELHHRGFIERYIVDGLALIQVIAFDRHQNPHHRELPSKLPPPPMNGHAHEPEARPDDSKADPWFHGHQARGQPRAEHEPEAFADAIEEKAQGQPEASPGPAQGNGAIPSPSSRADSLIPDSLNPSSLIPDSLIPDSGADGRASSTLGASAPPSTAPPLTTKAGEIGKAFKRAGVDPTQLRLTDPVLLALIDQGAEPAEFEEAARDALARGIERPWAYVLKAVQGRRRDAQRVTLAPKPVDPMAWRKTTEGVFAMGQSLGVKPRETEMFDVYERRVVTAFQRRSAPPPAPPAQQGAAA